jgi:hypothetical protein
MKTKPYIIVFLLSLIAGYFLVSCEKDIEVKVPPIDAQVVVEGTIEPGQPPFILVSWSQNFFDPLSIEAFNSYFIHDAEVYVNDVLMEEVCTDALPDSLLPILSELTGIALENLSVLNFCVYSNPFFNPLAVIGEEGETYRLRVVVGDREMTAITAIPPAIPLNNLYYQTWANTDSLGLIWGNLTDPDTLGNAYRWYAKRINRSIGNPPRSKDLNFYAPLGSAFDDNFINGTTFDFGYGRATGQNSTATDDNNAERGFFKEGDTVVVKFCTITPAAARSIRTLETQVGSTGNPFASPANIESMINGGLGLWIGYGVSYDTIPCYP